MKYGLKCQLKSSIQTRGCESSDQYARYAQLCVAGIFMYGLKSSVLDKKYGVLFSIEEVIINIEFDLL